MMPWIKLEDSSSKGLILDLLLTKLKYFFFLMKISSFQGDGDSVKH